MPSLSLSSVAAFLPSMLKVTTAAVLVVLVMIRKKDTFVTHGQGPRRATFNAPLTDVLRQSSEPVRAGYVPFSRASVTVFVWTLVCFQRVPSAGTSIRNKAEP